jgi:hypothetical protein
MAKISKFELQMANGGFRISNLGFGIWDFELRICPTNGAAAPGDGWKSLSQIWYNLANMDHIEKVA